MKKFRVGADIGGTFTDIVVLAPCGELRRHKLLSTPDDYARAVLEGLSVLIAPDEPRDAFDF